MKNQERTIIIALSVALLLTITFSLYHIGWEAYEANIQKAYKQGVSDVNQKDIFLRGVNTAVSQVIAQAEKGKVVINTDGGQIVLVPVKADPNTIGGK